jgi:hypothetical protein
MAEGIKQTPEQIVSDLPRSVESQVAGSEIQGGFAQVLEQGITPVDVQHIVTERLWNSDAVPILRTFREMFGGSTRLTPDGRRETIPSDFPEEPSLIKRLQSPFEE